jgi:hypothetical protein
MPRFDSLMDINERQRELVPLLAVDADEAGNAFVRLDCPLPGLAAGERPLGLTLDALWAAKYLLVQRTWAQAHERFELRFSRPVAVRVNARKVREMDRALVGLFNSRSGQKCYTFHHATGYPLAGPLVEALEALAAPNPFARERATLERVLRLKDRIHPNAWGDLREKIEANPRRYLDYRLVEISMTSVFGERVVAELERAFAEKRNYRHSLSGRRRDRSVETRLCDDGVFRAWYSSEYAGTGNGGYYLLINPRVASFLEYD